MATTRHRAARRRDWGRRAALFSGLALAGAVGGWFLGDAATEGRMLPAAPQRSSFAELSANPDALTADPTAAAPCINCADSYGAAARLRARREERADVAAFRKLGAIEIDRPADRAPATEADESYQYGGTFAKAMAEQAPLFEPKVRTPPAVPAAMEATKAKAPASKSRPEP